METSETAMALFVNDTRPQGTLVSYVDKKGAGHVMTAEGALFKGGPALAALKDAAMEAALSKATNGRYRAAADILCAAFPSVGRAAEKLIGTPWANKSTMGTLINAVLRAEPGKSGEFSKKQAEARLLARALTNLPAFRALVEGEVVEAEELSSAQ